MKKICFALALASTISCHSAFADDEPIPKGWLGGFLEYYNADEDKFDPAAKDDSGLGFGLELGKFFDPDWAFRFEVAKMNLDEFSGNESIDGYRVGIDAMYFPWEHKTYFFGGLKQEFLDTRYGMANIGVGRHWDLTEQLKLITEIAAYHDFGQSDKDFSAKIGLAWYLPDTNNRFKAADSDNDGVIDSNDSCPGTPGGVSVDSRGCPLDSDNDGVPNHKDQCPDSPPGASVNSQGCSLDSDNDGIPDHKDQCPATPAGDKVDKDGCSMSKEIEESISLAVQFANNSAVVENPEHPDIVAFANFMKRHPEANAVIEGHTSAPGDAAYNMQLSQQRADAVKALLIKQYGISASRLDARGYGETRLLDTSDSWQAHKMNRRITATVTGKKRVTLKQ